MSTRDVTKTEQKLLNLFKQKQPFSKSLRKILIEGEYIVLDFGMGTPNDLIYIRLDGSGVVAELRLPRQLFPKFEGTHVVSNFRQKKQYEMMIAVSTFYDINFIRSFISVIRSSEAT